jgi:hypothetical protein
LFRRHLAKRTSTQRLRPRKRCLDMSEKHKAPRSLPKQKGRRAVGSNKLKRAKLQLGLEVKVRHHRSAVRLSYWRPCVDLLLELILLVVDQLRENSPHAGLDFNNIVFRPGHTMKPIQVRCQMRDGRPSWLESIQAITDRGIDFGFRSHRQANCKRNHPPVANKMPCANRVGWPS